MVDDYIGYRLNCFRDEVETLAVALDDNGAHSNDEMVREWRGGFVVGLLVMSDLVIFGIIIWMLIRGL